MTDAPCRALGDAGITEQPAPRERFVLTEPVVIERGKATLVALPHDRGLAITYVLDDHDGALAGPQLVDLEVTEEVFLREIAPARTFCLAREMEALLALGLGRGASDQNTCVYEDGGIRNNRLRFADEAARHKVLDLIGDLALCGPGLHARIVAVRSGHRENMALVRELARRMELPMDEFIRPPDGSGRLAPRPDAALGEVSR